MSDAFNIQMEVTDEMKERIVNGTPLPSFSQKGALRFKVKDITVEMELQIVDEVTMEPLAVCPMPSMKTGYATTVFDIAKLFTITVS